MTTETKPFIPNITPATQATQDLLKQMVALMTEQTGLIRNMAEEIAHLREVAEAGAEASSQTAERLERAMQTLATVAVAGPAGAPQAIAAPVAGNYETFPATAIEFGIMAGKSVYKIKGGRWQKFGVPIYPEAMLSMGITAASLNPGDNPLTGNVVALIGEKGPQKIVAWAK